MQVNVNQLFLCPAGVFSMCWRLLAFLAVLGAQQALASVSVREVDFRWVEREGSARWLECQLEVEVRRDEGDRDRKRADYLDDLRVELLLGFEVSRNGGPAFEFYRSEAELVTLAEGRHAVRFYLPPEILVRDQLAREPHSFLAYLSRDGEDLGAFFSASLTSETVRESFLRRVDEESAANEGILLPQNETPFLGAYPRSTPSFKRANRLE